jgi:tRNA threonylcarbamoyladenosine biosynthesis protein TsaB
MSRLLAFDTSTDLTSIALCDGDSVRVSESAGGAQASAKLIPELLALLAEVGWKMDQLDAIAFGRGPGAFTGLRTAASVAQGLAFGAGKPVLPIDSLLLVAEDARLQRPVPEQPFDLWVAMDARMEESYAAAYRWRDGRWQVVTAPALYTLAALNAAWRAAPPACVAGSALSAFGERLSPGDARCVPEAFSRAAALGRLAEQAWREGGAVDADHAIPVYLRDKVALTTVEREAVKAEKERAA